MRTLVVHDVGAVGLLSGVVLARVFQRAGEHVELASASWCEAARHVPDAWRWLEQVDVDDVDRVVLVSVAYDARQPHRCLSVLRRLTRQTTTALEVWSHRWPDDYHYHAGLDVAIPPQDIAERHRFALEPAELQLLRLALPAGREIALSEMSDSDRYLVRALDHQLLEPDVLRTALWEDPQAALERLEQVPAQARSVPPGDAEMSWAGECTVLIDLAASNRARAEKVVEALLEQRDVPADTIAIAFCPDPEPRILLVRAGSDRKRPSLRWLLQTYGPRFGLPPLPAWVGPQDAVSLLLGQPRLPERSKLAERLSAFCEHVAPRRTGQRRPPAGLLRPLWRSAQRALRSLDLLGEHVQGCPPALSIDPGRISQLLATGNRSGVLRETCIVRVTARTPDAAQFLFAGGGYNLTKLENELQGVLHGLAEHRTAWLAGDELPGRLRVDVEFQEQALEEFPRAMQEAAAVRLVATDAATDSGLLAPGSSMRHAVTDLGLPGVVVHHGSETIGPSVPYALLLSEAARIIADSSQRAPCVLDLFAGSGTGMRSVLAVRPDARVHAVDATVAGLEQREHRRYPSALWLRADAIEVLHGHPVDESYDLIGMDPPHAALFDLLLSRRDGLTALEAASRRAPWLVLYQGHTTQSGRAWALAHHLREVYARVCAWTVGQELLLLAGPDTAGELSFDRLVHSVEPGLRDRAGSFGWQIEVGEPHPVGEDSW